jgi:hypothetical protein
MKLVIHNPPSQSHGDPMALLDREFPIQPTYQVSEADWTKAEEEFNLKFPDSFKATVNRVAGLRFGAVLSLDLPDSRCKYVEILTPFDGSISRLNRRELFDDKVPKWPEVGGFFFITRIFSGFAICLRHCGNGECYPATIDLDGDDGTSIDQYNMDFTAFFISLLLRKLEGNTSIMMMQEVFEGGPAILDVYKYEKLMGTDFVKHLHHLPNGFFVCEK